MPPRKSPATTLDTLAVLMQDGLEALRKEIRQVDLGLREEMRVSRKETREFQSEVREQFEKLEERAFPTSYDREDLEARIALIERKLNIESGK